MKTAVKQTRAEEYVGRGSPHLDVRSDQFINRNVTRQVIRRQENNSRPGGHYGGTTTAASSERETPRLVYQPGCLRLQTNPFTPGLDLQGGLRRGDSLS